LRRVLAVPLVGLPPGIVDVWCVPLRSPEVAPERLTAPLLYEERAYAERLRGGGEAWGAAHGALRCVLAHYLGRPAESLRFVRTRLGKPRLAGGGPPHFNLSWREDLALIAVASDREVGVDLERERGDVAIESLARDFLSTLEAAAIRQAEPARRRAAFFAAWTRHEARRKLHGLALEDALPELDPNSVVVVRALTVPAGYAAAIAAEGSTWRVRMRDVDEAL